MPIVHFDINDILYDNKPRARHYAVSATRYFCIAIDDPDTSGQLILNKLDIYTVDECCFAVGTCRPEYGVSLIRINALLLHLVS